MNGRRRETHPYLMEVNLCKAKIRLRLPYHIIKVNKLIIHENVELDIWIGVL